MNDNTQGPEDPKPFRVITGGKSEYVAEQATPTQPAQSDIPQNVYVIVDINGDEHFAEGFLLFTSQHIAIMRDTGSGALPILVMPLDKVFSAELLEDDSDEIIDGLVL